MRLGGMMALVLSGLGLALAGFAPAAAQVLPGANGLLTSFHASGSKRFSEKQVAALAELRPGEQVTQEDFQKAADRLARLGLFSNVHYRFASEGPNVTLEFAVEDAPAFPVSFDNFPWFARKEIVEALEAALPAYDGMAPRTGSYLDEMTEALGRLLATRHVQGTIEHNLVRDPMTDEMVQQFRVAGQSLPIAAVRFSDPLAGNDPHVRDRLGDLMGKPFSCNTVEMFLVEQVRPVYWEHGYLKARFERPEARFFGNPDAALRQQVMAIVLVVPGPAYRWAGASWTGNSVFDATALDRMLGLRDGELANGMKIEGAWDRIREQYGSQGYLDAQLTPTPVYDDARGVVRYRVTIREGEQYRMGKLEVSGLSLKAEQRLRQSWQIHPGQIFDQAYFDEFLRSIVKEAFAGMPVHYARIGHLLQRNRENKTVDVLLDFE
jgi:outer membrane protein insertion porin family